MANGEAGEPTCGAQVHRAMRRGSKATWQGRGWPTRGAGGARRGHVAKRHATTRVTWAPVWGAMWQAGKWRAHGNSGTLVSSWGR